MSTPQPPRRRRIAGESKPGTKPAKTAVAKKAAGKLRPPRKPSAAPTKAPPSEEPTRQKAPEGPPAVAAPSRLRRFRMSRVSTRFGALVALTVAALVFGGVFGFRGISEWRSGGGVVEAHDEAATAAASAGETIFTYKFDQLDDHLRDAKATMTPKFADKFETISPALEELAPQRKVEVRATVRNAAAMECGSKCSEDRATILVFLDQERLADESEEPTVFGNRIKMLMVEQDGRWLVNDIQSL